MNTHDNDMSRDEMAGHYVLGTLTEEEHREVSDRMREDEQLAEAVRYWQERLVGLCDVAEPVEVRESVWERISASIDELDSRPETAGDSPVSWMSSWWNNLVFWRGFSAAGFACALALAITLVAYQPASSKYMVVLATPEGHSPGWVVQASTSRKLTLKALGSFEIPEGKALEFWTKADDWDGPVSLGLVEPGQPIQISLDDLPPLEENQLFEITLENYGGSPIGRPTGPIQFIGRAVTSI
ncbi:RNA polymerase subunit sigma-70 [Marinobacter salinexigens]|uniref:RNA polymerase subunit sigma-70 n=1 Tax=Marinobacter salinexigens TaxID=2919747 RepID=A0A5B0VPM2_9GAMM|nr:anti-sigma factor [Marinobacter salinexigens]KAA1175951.1 RNA polymerase subunit sigma-70 [Marinobacter salinexigens]